MTVHEVLSRIITGLNAARIPFMLTGSLAATVHGAARATMDIDLVIEADAERLNAFVDAIEGPGLYVSRDAALEALERESMFNVVDVQTGWKADLMIRRERAFSKTEFDRRQPMDFDGLRLWVATVEDLIVAKLEWAKLGGSARQLEDVARLLRVSGEDIDTEYLQRWIHDLGISPEWEAARNAEI